MSTFFPFHAYHFLSCKVDPSPLRGVLDTTLCDKVCQWLAADQWCYHETPVSSTNKTEHYIRDSNPSRAPAAFTSGYLSLVSR